LDLSRSAKSSAASTIARVGFIQRIDDRSAKSFAIYDGGRIDVDNDVAAFFGRSKSCEVEVARNRVTAWEV
jgi:hypothetical protein